MSLILDALRKLERERDARESSVLVVGAVPWGATRRSRLPLALASLALVLFASAGWWWWRSPRRPDPSAAVAPSATLPSPGPSRAPVAPLPPPPASAPSAPPRASSEPVPPPRRLDVPSPGEADAGPALAEESPAEKPAAAVGTGRAPGELQLNAITERDGRPMALINDRLVFEGDSFDGVKVLHIGEAEVEVDVRGRRRVLRF